MVKKQTTKAKIIRYIRSHVPLVAGFAIFAVIGIVMLSVSRAATGIVSSEAESGNGSNGALVAVDSSASGGKAMVFGPANPSGVQIGSRSFALSGTNVSRDINQMVRYTYNSAQTATPTNMYGVEAVVNLSTNKVTAVNDRIANSDAAATQIPEGSYVLSAHGQGGATAGQWLRDNAKVGAVVMLTDAGPTTPTPSPTPGPNPTPAPSTSALPAKVLSMWHHRWEGPSLRNWPSDVQSKVNLVVLGLAQGCGGGCLEYSPLNGQSVADHAADIRAYRARGVNILMGFGGSSATIAITNESQVTQAFNSIVGFVNTYGISGIDVDLETSGASWNEQSLNSLAKQLKAKYGKNFIIGLTPGLYGQYTAKWLSAARLMGDNYDYMAPMLYDFPEAGDSRLVSVSVQKADAMVAGGVPQNKMIMGYMARPDSSYTNSTPTSALMLQAYAAVEAKYPNVRGFFVWEDKIMAARNWDFVRDAIKANQP